jgi:hypothetical protein
MILILRERIQDLKRKDYFLVGQDQGQPETISKKMKAQIF